MAKSSSVPGLDRIRGLFTSAELAVLKSTSGKTLLAASRKQIEKTLAQARVLRDKWRDLHAGQSRTTKRSASAATVPANARSREKSDMFSAAINRLQARLAEAGSGPAAGKVGKTAAAGAVKGKPVTKAARTVGHRTTRAGMKGKLTAKTAELNRSHTSKRVGKPAAKTPKRKGTASPGR